MPNPLQPMFRVSPKKPKAGLSRGKVGLKRGSKPLKKTRLKGQSKKRRLESAKYQILKLKHFVENPQCQHPDGCFKTWPFYDMDLHHAATRHGPLLTCTKYFRTACRQHHNLAKYDPIGSRANGWLIDLTPEQVRQIALEQQS